MTRRALAALVVGLSLSVATAACADNEGFSFEDLGPAGPDADCVARAEQVFEIYRAEVNTGAIATGAWTAVLYDIVNDAYDAAIICNGEMGGPVRATVMVYANDGTDAALRRTIAARLKEIWKETN